MQSKSTKSFFYNPWTILVAGLIGTPTVDYLTGANILPTIWNWLIGLNEYTKLFLNTKYEWPLYNFILFFLLLLTLALFIYSMIRHGSSIVQYGTSKTKAMQPNTPEWIKYTEESFNEVIYRWEFAHYNQKWHIINIVPFCQYCDCQIIQGDCPSCGTSFDYKLKEDPKLIALIQQRIRNNSYKRNPNKAA